MTANRDSQGPAVGHPADEIQRLVAQARGGDGAASQRLLERYRGRIRFEVRRTLRAPEHGPARGLDECQHEAEQKIRRALLDGNVEYRGQPAFEGWLRRVTRN